MYNLRIAKRNIRMSNLTPDDVDLRLTAAKAELTEEDQRLWLGLEDEKISRIAGDEANKQFTELVKQQNSGTESRLSTEVIHRSEGDVSNLNSLNAVAQALSDYRIKTDLEINNEVIARKALGVDLNSRIDSFMASWDHDKFLIYRTIQEVQDDVDGKYVSMDTRITKYEQMLSDITTDSIQITMDNGEINMGAWTILSQAREWDLQIIGRMKDFQIKTEEDLNQALEDIQNKLPVEQDIIDKVIEVLSNAPIIKELDAKIVNNIADIDRVHQELLTEVTTRQNEMVAQAQNTADELKKQSEALSATIAAEADARIDAIEREASIRAAQLEQEALDRSAEIDEKIQNVDIVIDGRIDELDAKTNDLTDKLRLEEEARIADINTLSDGLTTERDLRVAGDSAVMTELTNYKVSNNQALANVRSELETNVTKTTANTSLITALDTRLTANEDLAASAVSKADTALTETSALATQMDAVNISINGLNTELGKKADATALNQLQAEVTAIDGVVTNTANAVTVLRTDLTSVDNKVTGNTSAISNLNTKQITQDGQITQLTQDNTLLKNSVTTIEEDLATKVETSAFNELNTRVTTAENAINVQSQDLTRLQNALDVTNAAVATKAESSALNALTSEVTTINNKVTVNSNAITSLSGRVTTVEQGLTTKLNASVINAYSTTVDMNKAIASSITTYNADLVIGGENLYLGANPIALSGRGGELVVSADSTATFQMFKYLTAAELDITQLSVGDKTVASMEFFIPAATNNDFEFRFATYRFNPSNIGGGYNQTAVLKASQFPRDKWFQIALPAGVLPTTATTATAINISVYVFKRFTGDTLRWRNLMMEKGTKASSYSEPTSILKTNINANATAIQSTNASVTALDGRVTSNSSAITSLNNRMTVAEGNISQKADASALSTLDTKVTTIDGKVTTQGAAITKLQNDLVITDQKVETKADANALSTLSNKVEGIDGRVTANSSALSSLTNRVNTVEGDVTKKADSTAVNALTSRVETAEGQITSQGSAVTKLQNDLVITANTANAALPQITTAEAYKAFRNVLNYYIASSAIPVTSNLVITTPITFSSKMTNISIKGYMYKGSNTTIDLRLGFYAYNLSSFFLQTSVTNNGSFPFKVRLAVKDGKVVIILSSATAMTMAYPQFGVDAEFGYSLAPDTWKDGWSCAVVTEAGLDAYGVTNITTPPIFDPKTEITANATAIQTLDNKVTQNGTDIASISTAQTVLSNRITTVEGTLTNKADASAVSQLDSRVTVAEGKITTNTTAITNLSSRITTTENNLTATNSAVSGLTTRVSATETGITNLALQNTQLKADLSSGGAVNLGVAAFTDPQTLIQMFNGGHTPSLVASELRTNGKAYNIRNTSTGAGNYIYMGVFNDNSKWKEAPLRVRTGKRYLISAFMKSDALPAQVSMQLRVFAGDGVNTGTLTGALVTTGAATNYATLTNNITKYTWTIPVIGLANAQTATILFRGNLLGTTPVNANIMIDNIMFEELVGDPVEGSPYVPGNADLFGIDASIKANASAITETRAEVTRIDGVVQTQATTITGLQTQIAGKADTSAVTSLTTRITAAEGDITSLSNQTTTLTNRMTAAEGNITATSNTLSTLNNKVTDIDGKVTAQGTALTKVESDLSGMIIGGANLWSLQATGIYSAGVVTAPHASVTVAGNVATYTSKGVSDRIGCNVPLTSGQPVTVRFKPVSGVTDGIVYVCALTSTGAQADSQNTAAATLKDGYYTVVLPSTQFPATTASVNFGIGGAGTGTVVVSEITVQVGNTATTWTDSYRDIPEVDLSSYAKAAALTALDTKVTTIDGKVTAQASLITQLQTDVSGNSAKLIVQGDAVDGLKASYVVKTDVNGLVAGYGLYNTGSSSAFGVNADFFYVGKGTTAENGKKPFMVLTTPTTIGGVTYPAGTWIDVALIANATIGTAHIADASITNAKISSLDAAKITTGTLDAARIKVGADTQYEVGYDPITKARTFVAQPVTPYRIGDIWKNGSTTSICTVTRLSGAYVAADWGKTGDVTSLNTAADTSKVGGVAAATVNQNITNAQTAATNADSKAVAAQTAADSANNQVNAWKFTGTTEIDGGKIRADTVTAVQIDVAELSAISGNLGTLTSTSPQGTTTMTGSLIEVRDSSGQLRVKLGVW